MKNVGVGTSVVKFVKLYRYQLLLLLACIIGYFEITFFIFSPKWDNINGFLPYRHIVGTWILGEHFPLWNPYQLLGSPMHSDPQSGAWYPIVWLLSLFKGYDLYSINIELSLHYFISGIGMFSLGRTLKLKDTTAFIMGLAYMFSGFMVGTSQIMVMIIAAAWFPFSINYLLISLKNPTFKNLFLLAFINFLIVTGSYPAMTIILVYIYLLIAGYYFYLYFKGKFVLKTIITVFGVQSFLLLLLTGGYFYSIYEMMPYLSRAKGIPYTDLLFARVSFTIQSFISFLMPYATTANTKFFQSDGSMINGYFGLFSVIFITYGLVYFRSKRLIITLLLAVFVTLIATGKQLPFHYLMYSYLPGFNLFRHPSIFRVYAIFLFVLSLGYSFDYFLKDPEKFKHITVVLKGAAIFFFLIVVIAAFRTKYELLPDLYNVLIQFKEKSPLNLSGHILIHGIIQLIFISIAYFLARCKKLKTKTIIYLVFIDLFVATQLNARRTIHYSVPFKGMQEYVASKPKGLTNQTLKDKILKINEKSVKPKTRGINSNMNSYAKRTAYDGYNPVKFNDFLVLRNSEIFDNVLNNPLFYIPKKTFVYPLTDAIKNVPGQAFLGKELFSKYSEISTRGKLSKLKIEYNGFAVKAQINRKGLVFLLQNYHHNWHAFVDDKEVEIVKANIGLMAFEVPVGEHNITIKYRSKVAIIGFYISLLTISLGFLIILFQYLKREKNTIPTKKRRP
jgi:hypothetical protein